jgi:hypothetical protein
MFIRKKKNSSGTTSVQIIDKSSGKYKVWQTIGAGITKQDIDALVHEAQLSINKHKRFIEIDFDNYRNKYNQFFNSITAHRLVGIDYVLGKLFDEIEITIPNQNEKIRHTILLTEEHQTLANLFNF